MRRWFVSYAYISSPGTWVFGNCFMETIDYKHPCEQMVSEIEDILKKDIQSCKVVLVNIVRAGKVKKVEVES